MNVHKSVLKRERQNIVRRKRNRVIKSKVHTAFRHLNDAIRTKDTATIDQLFKNYMSEVDKAVKKNVFHKRNGARKKSKMSNVIKLLINK